MGLFAPWASEFPEAEGAPPLAPPRTRRGGETNEENTVRLLLINPNMTAAVTERLAAVGRAVANPDTEIVALTASRGFPYISARSEAEIAGVLAMEMIADHAEGARAPTRRSSPRSAIRACSRRGNCSISRSSACRRPRC